MEKPVMLTQPTPDDARVQQTLTAFADAHRDSSELVLELKEGLATALSLEFGIEIDGTSTRGTLARSAMDLLTADNRYRSEAQALLAGPAPERFAAIETALLVTSALVVLQMHVRFERKDDGKWTVRIEKKPTDAALLKALVSKLLAFVDRP